MKARFFLIVIVTLLACTLSTPGAVPTPTSLPATQTQPVAPEQGKPTPTTTPSSTLQPTTGAEDTGVELAAFTADTSGPFGMTGRTSWQPSPYAGEDYDLPIELSLVANSPVISGLTDEQRTFLEQNGFVVIQSQVAQYSDLRERASRIYGQPYYLTTDAAFHALHLTFNELLKALEREQLRPRMIALTLATLDGVISSMPQVQGTSIEEDTRLAAAYLAVALKLFDPQANLDPSLEDLVSPQIEQIVAGEGRDTSVLVPGFEDDYGAYKPVGHYAGDPALEAYFQGMTWLGRVHFKLKSPDPGIIPSRTPLIITLALRRAEEGDRTAAEDWAAVHEVLTFLVGPSDDSGPMEYAALMDQVYGRRVTPSGLADDNKWQDFIQRGEELPAPQINSTFVTSLSDLEEEVGWRFMGQRFTLDAFVLQNLVFDKVGTPDKKRKLPSGLDVMAAIGSQAALQALDEGGETAYHNYLEQMAILRQAVQSQPETEWLNTSYSAWLYAFFPQLAPKDANFPAYMRTQSWAYKDLNSALGSWAELKHDTALYSKMPEFAGGGGPPSSGPAPGYVEPNPEVFYRLAYLAKAIAEGLTLRSMSDSLVEPSPGDFTYPDGIERLLSGTEGLANLFQKLGELAVKELAGISLDSTDYGMIQGCLGPVECKVLYMQEMHSYGVGPDQEMPPFPIVAAVAGAVDQILEVGVGYLDRIFVVSPLENKLQIAQGGVFSYYEFPQPRSNRLTDQEWRDRLDTSAPERPTWVTNFALPGGEPADHLAFRVGDFYIITEAGADLNLRENPSTSAEVLSQLQPGDYVEIVGGPVNADGYTWWNVASPLGFEAFDGWVVEHQEWYVRAWGQ